MSLKKHKSRNRPCGRSWQDGNLLPDDGKPHDKKEGKMYKYGMKLRGFSIGCQPMDGFVERQDDTSGRYWDILVYNRPLTDRELRDYDLEEVKRV